MFYSASMDVKGLANLKDKMRRIVSFSLPILKARFLKRKIPLFVGWELTNRCNLKCRYCGVAHAVRGGELDTQRILLMVDGLKLLGTRFISFTGGEPLLRPDIGLIIDYCRQKNVFTSLNSNGILVKQKISEIKNVNCVCLSLDGAEEIHDSIRGAGVFKAVIEAARIIQRTNIPLKFFVTLTGINVNQIDFLINIAMEYNAVLVFQPSVQNKLYSNEVNEICLSRAENEMVFRQLICRKRRLRKMVIANSYMNLAHLSHWPHPRYIRCASGHITGRIKSNGDFAPCKRYALQTAAGASLSPMDLKRKYLALQNISCEECWCANRVELNLLFALQLEPIINSIRYLASNKK